jgi:hypothetical protein
MYVASMCVAVAVIFGGGGLCCHKSVGLGLWNFSWLLYLKTM